MNVSPPDYHEALEAVSVIMQNVLEKITFQKVRVSVRVLRWDFQFLIDIDGFKRISPSYDFLRVDLSDWNSILNMCMETFGLVYLSYLKESDNVSLSVNFTPNMIIDDAMRKELINSFEKRKVHLAPAYIMDESGNIHITEVSFVPTIEEVRE